MAQRCRNWPGNEPRPPDNRHCGCGIAAVSYQAWLARLQPASAQGQRHLNARETFMFPIPPDPDHSRVARFVERLDQLDAHAWERIAGRCDAIGANSLDGFLSRIELFARSVTPATSTYARPGARPAMALMGTIFGTMNEVAMMLGGGADDADQAAARLREQAPHDERKLAEAASLSLWGRAIRERARRPGLAAALNAVQMGLLLPQADPGALADVYSPFEPEIPLAALLASGEDAAA
jgi:hypothetical protein